MSSTRLFLQAGSDQPGLFISERRESLWATLPNCIGDDKNPVDMEKAVPDQSADAVRYVLTAANQKQHNFRGGTKSGPHPLMWAEDRRRAGDGCRLKAVRRW